MKILYSRKKKQESPAPPVSEQDLPEYRPPSTRDKILGTMVLIAACALFIALTVAICAPLLPLVSNPEKFERFIAEMGAWGRFVFVGVQMLQSILPIPLELTTVAGGYIFGRWQGLLLTVSSILISTTIIYYVSKAFGSRVIGLFLSPQKQKKIRYLNDPKLRNTLTWIFFLIPGLPKRMFVFSAGLTQQGFKQFLFISTVARLPALLACTFGGDALGEGNYGLAAALLILMVAVAVVSLVLYRRITGKKDKNHTGNP